MDENKEIIEEVNELRDEVNENAELTSEAGGSSTLLVLISGALALVIGVLTGKLIVKGYKKWKQARAEKKAAKEAEKEEKKNDEIIKKALKEYAEKHPEEFITKDDVDLEEEK